MTDTETQFSTSFRLLASLLLRPPATVEVLPGDSSTWFSDGAERSHFPFLFTESNLGVPETELHQSYLFASRVFATARKDSTTGLRTLGLSNSITPAIQDVICSSAVLVFVNPAHQTALNARKRLVERKLIDVGQELQFTTTLLSCRQCCKQGELWHHRRWLLQRTHPIQRRVDIAAGSQNFYLTSNDLSVEMSLVARACELYPRNYFGWTHRTICIQSTLTPIIHSIKSDEITEIPEILSKEVFSVMQWIESHVSDYSAVHHLVNLACLAKDPESALLPNDLQSLLFPIGRITTLVRAFPEHETLWLYLRGFWVEEDVTAAFVASFVIPLQSTGMADDGNVNRCPLGAHHARRFLEWRTQRLK